MLILSLFCILWRSGEHLSLRYIFCLVAKGHYSLGYSPLTWLTIRVSWTKLAFGEIKQRCFPSSPDIRTFDLRKQIMLPFSTRVLLDSDDRNCGNFQVTENDMQNLVKCKTNQTIEGVEVAFKPARVILQVL
ncbi:cytoplasmic aconitate hydratase-like [Aphis craccivora]|uniref:Cytoplasmic aconitate hydratase-like n=1 Tax=Aphis craccivora TaxID=307492 RepID=A0A6G0YA54_APHCR|nr:cytoplasmic aconitate hydratase-like [Aphis craccivora]